MGRDETSSVAYNLGETQTTIIYFSLFGREDFGEIPASLWQEKEDFKVLKRCSIQMYPTKLLAVLWKSCLSSTYVKFSVSNVKLF